MSDGDGDPPATPAAGDLQQQIADMTALVQLQLQSMTMQTQLNSTLAINHVKHVKVPEGHYHMNPNEFRTYRKDCVDYKKLTHYTDEQVVLQLRLHMDNELKRALDTNFITSWDTFTVNQAIEAIGQIMNRISNPVVFRKEFDSIAQREHESIVEFITRLKNCAFDCNFVCPFDENHDLTEYHLINRIRSGVINKKLQQELLQNSGRLNNLQNITEFCQNYELAQTDREKLSSDTFVSAIASPDTSQDELLAAISNYKKKKNSDRIAKQPKCRNCGYDWPHVNRKCPAFGQSCHKCQKMNHFGQVCKSPGQTHVSSVIISSIEHVLGIANKCDLPKLKVFISSDNNEPPISMEVVADTGAQVNVAGPDHLAHFGIQMDSLKTAPNLLKHAGGNLLQVLGSHPIFVLHNDKLVETEIYFASGVTNIYLSLDLCKKLCLIHEQFPHVNIDYAHTNGISNIDSPPLIPERPPTIPFPAIDSNIHKLETWLLQMFQRSTFNTSDHLPTMTGKPHKIHLAKEAIPYVAYTPIPIPHYWKGEVKKQLDEDVRLGILQEAPVGESSDWCMRMVTVAKKDGSPRRTVDFQPLNKYCQREIHHTPPPIDIVSSIPPQSYKTVLDAFNGYHQVPLSPESISLTTFLTEFGRYQYLRAPQGHISSNDAYTRRYDDVIKDVPRQKKVVDDTLLFDGSIEDAFYHTFDYLVLCSTNGITINPKKFKFARREVDFVGYNIGWLDYHPSDDMFKSIKEFNMPANPTLTDIRSWFGLVNQLNPFLATSRLMSPFPELLKSSNTNSTRKIY